MPNKVKITFVGAINDQTEVPEGATLSFALSQVGHVIDDFNFVANGNSLDKASAFQTATTVEVGDRDPNVTKGRPGTISKAQASSSAITEPQRDTTPVKPGEVRPNPDPVYKDGKYQRSWDKASEHADPHDPNNPNNPNSPLHPSRAQPGAGFDEKTADAERRAKGGVVDPNRPK